MYLCYVKIGIPSYEWKTNKNDVIKKYVSLYLIACKTVAVRHAAFLMQFKPYIVYIIIYVMTYETFLTK